MPDDTELRLREMPVDSDGRLGIAFVVGGRAICDFGAMPTSMHSSIAGNPPSPEDTRRIEVAWNMHEELVAMLEILVDGYGDDWPRADHNQIVNAARKLLTKAQEGQVARSDAGDAEGEG